MAGLVIALATIDDPFSRQADRIFVKRLSQRSCQRPRPPLAQRRLRPADDDNNSISCAGALSRYQRGIKACKHNT